MRADIVAVVEAAYRVELAEEAWLGGILEAVRPALDHGRGVNGYLFDASDPAAVRGWGSLVRGDSPLTPQAAVATVTATSPDYVRATWLRNTCQTASESPGYDDLDVVRDVFRPAGVHDLLVVNAVNPDGRGLWLGGALAKRMTSRAARSSSWTRVRGHLAAALRIRRTLERTFARTALDGAEAVIEPGGAIAHAEGPAKQAAARQALREAVRALDRARSAPERAEPDQALASWKGLVGARWSLVDVIENDGRRLLVARENRPHADGLDALTGRERQVAALAALGGTTKEIAYDLGIAPSTVRVLMARALAKLGLRRDELVERLGSAR